jgi:hypothetical protein
VPIGNRRVGHGQQHICSGQQEHYSAGQRCCNDGPAGCHDRVHHRRQVTSRTVTTGHIARQCSAAFRCQYEPSVSLSIWAARKCIRLCVLNDNLVAHVCALTSQLPAVPQCATFASSRNKEFQQPSLYFSARMATASTAAACIADSQSGESQAWYSIREVQGRT